MNQYPITEEWRSRGILWGLWQVSTSLRALWLFARMMERCRSLSPSSMIQLQVISLTQPHHHMTEPELWERYIRMCGEIDHHDTHENSKERHSLLRPGFCHNIVHQQLKRRKERLKRFEETKVGLYSSYESIPDFQTFVAGSKGPQRGYFIWFAPEDPKYLCYVDLYAFSGVNDSSLFTTEPEASSIDLLVGDAGTKHTLSDNKIGMRGSDGYREKKFKFEGAWVGGRRQGLSEVGSLKLSEQLLAISGEVVCHCRYLWQSSSGRNWDS